MTATCRRDLITTAALAGVLAGVLADVLAERSAGAAVRGPFTLESVRALAARATAVAAIVSTTSGPEVLLLARDGAREPMAVVGRWPAGPAAGGSPDGRRAQRQRSGSDIDDTLWLYDLGDADRDTWVIEDLLEQEGLDDGERRARGAASKRRNDQQPIPRALAAAATEVWMATSRGVWRLHGQGTAARWQPRGLEGHDIAQIAVAREDSGRLLVSAVAGGTLWRSTDLGQTWQPEPAGGFAGARVSDRTRPSLREPALPADVTATAVTGEEIWIGTAHGLYAADVEDDLDQWRAAGLFRDTVTAELSLIDGAEPRTDPRPVWFRYVPHVAVEVGTRLRAGRMEVRGLIVVTVPLARALP